MNKEIIVDIKLVFHPLTRTLNAKYGDCVTTHIFNDMDEWVEVNYKGDNNHPCYYHIELHYDECLQLCCYPRNGNDEFESLNENDGTYWNSNKKEIVQDNLRVVYNDSEEKEALQWLNE